MAENVAEPEPQQRCQWRLASCDSPKALCLFLNNSSELVHAKYFSKFIFKFNKNNFSISFPFNSLQKHLTDVPEDNNAKENDL